VTACVSIVSTYILLNAEDYRWHWFSFLAGASAAGYIGIYSVYYYGEKTNMEGSVQTTFYFGWGKRRKGLKERAGESAKERAKEIDNYRPKSF
jgi:hypothetical protein